MSSAASIPSHSRVARVSHAVTTSSVTCHLSSGLAQDGVTVKPGLFLQLNVDSKVRGDDGNLVDMCWALDNDM